MKMKYIGSERHGFKRGDVWKVEIVGFIPAKDILCEMTKPNQSIMIRKRYGSLSSLLSNWERVK